MTTSAEAALQQIPDDFDVDLIGDNSTLNPAALAALRAAALRRAERDPIWFLENFWHVLNPFTFKWEKFNLRDYQYEDAEWILEGFDIPRSRNVAGKARQIGMTTIVVAMAGWDMFFNSYHPWYISNKTQPDAQKTMKQRLKTPYLMMPMWFRQALAAKYGAEKFLLNDNQESMEFANGSRVDSVVSTPNVGRSDVVYGVIMDEAAFQEYADDVFTALDPLCYGPMFVISTGNGMGNFFHSKWMDSTLKDSEWRRIFHPWSVVPGRTQKWYNSEKLKYRGSEWRFYQEYPANEEEMFAKTGMAVLPMDLLREQGCWCPPTYRINLDKWWDDDENWREFLEDDEQAANELHVWTEPRIERHPEKGYSLRDPNYAIFCDVAEGLEHGDRTSITVYDLNNVEEVAAYRGWWPVEDLGELLDHIGRWYFNALMIVERNNMGIVAINDLYKTYRYPRMFRMPQLAQIQLSDRTPRFGWITSGPSKAKMVADFSKAIRDDTLILHDERFLEEAATFIKDGKGGFNASPGNYDDHVISHMGAWQGFLEIGSYPTIFQDDEGQKPPTFADLFEAEARNQETRSPLEIGIGRGRKQRGDASFTF